MSHWATTSDRTFRKATNKLEKIGQKQADGKLKNINSQTHNIINELRKVDLH